MTSIASLLRHRILRQRPYDVVRASSPTCLTPFPSCIIATHQSLVFSVLLPTSRVRSYPSPVFQQHASLVSPAGSTSSQVLLRMATKAQSEAFDDHQTPPQTPMLAATRVAVEVPRHGLCLENGQVDGIHSHSIPLE